MLRLIGLLVFILSSSLWAQENRTETLIETISKSFMDQSISQYAYSVSGGKGSIKGGGNYRQPQQYSQTGVQVGSRVWKNLWLEGAYSQGVETDLPVAGLDTKIETFIGRVRYNIEFNSYFHLQPYLGYFDVQATSPHAGQGDGTVTAAELDAEKAAVSEIDAKNGLAAGISLMLTFNKFMTRVDYGSDIVAANIGFLF